MRIGAQLYTVREFIQTESCLDETISKIAGIGYDCAQLSAVGPIEPAIIKRVFNNHGVEIIITHTNPNRLLNDTEAVIDEHNLYGADYIGIGSMPEKYRPIGDERFKLDGIKWFIEDFGPVAEKFRKAGKKFMYHNHDFEFERLGGKLVLEHLIDGFSADLMGFTLDVYWVQAGGADPAYWLKKLSGRIDTIHYKDMAVKGRKIYMAEAMEGNLNWDKIIPASIEGGAKWAFVEQDDCYGANPFKCMETSFDNLTNALAGYKG